MPDMFQSGIDGNGSLQFVNSNGFPAHLSLTDHLCEAESLQVEEVASSPHAGLVTDFSLNSA